MELMEVAEGFAKGQIKVESFHNNLYGGMHGGCLYALADAVSGIAAASFGHYVTTLNGSMNYLKAAKDTASVICEATAVKAGKNVIVIDARIMSEDGMLFATANFNYYVLEMEL